MLFISIKTRTFAAKDSVSSLVQKKKIKNPKKLSSQTVKANNPVCKDFFFFLCQLSSRNSQTGMWLQLIFTRSFIFYCAPLVFCIALYHWSKKGVGGWCSVPLKPKREAQHLSGELLQEKLFAWKSKADKSNRPIISQAVFILPHLSGIATREATSPAEVPQRRTTFLHDANQKNADTPPSDCLPLPPGNLVKISSLNQTAGLQWRTWGRCERQTGGSTAAKLHKVRGEN